MKSSAFLVTSTSIVFATPSRVTFTGTTFLPSLSVIFPYSTVSVSFNALPFAVTFSFTASLSACSVKLSPALGTTEIFAAPSFTAKVKSSAFLVTSTSTVFATPSRVTVTGTTFFPSFSLIGPYVTVSVGLRASLFAVTFSFTFAWSSAVKLSPATGVFEISAGFVASFTANVNSLTSTSTIWYTLSRPTVTGT